MYDLLLIFSNLTIDYIRHDIDLFLKNRNSYYNSHIDSDYDRLLDSYSILIDKIFYEVYPIVMKYLPNLEIYICEESGWVIANTYFDRYYHNYDNYYKGLLGASKYDRPEFLNLLLKNKKEHYIQRKSSTTDIPTEYFAKSSKISDESPENSFICILNYNKYFGLNFIDNNYIDKMWSSEDSSIFISKNTVIIKKIKNLDNFSISRITKDPLDFEIGNYNNFLFQNINLGKNDFFVLLSKEYNGFIKTIITTFKFSDNNLEIKYYPSYPSPNYEGMIIDILK